MRVLVTGATGFIGRALVPRLQRDGHTVVAWARSDTRARGRLGAAVEIVPASGGVEALVQALERCDAVVNLAGEPLMGSRWTAARRRILEDSRITVTKDLVRAMAAATTPPRVLISASAVGFYGDRGAEPLAETSCPGDGFLADLCRKWEAAAHAAEALGVRVVLLRTGVVLGRAGGALALMLPPFALGLGGPIGSGQQYLPWIHLHDLVNVMAVALVDGGYQGPVNGVAPEPATSRTFARALGRALHRPAIVPLPAVALKAIFGRAATVLLGSQRVAPRALKDHEFTFAFPTLDQALEDIVGGTSVAIVPATSRPPGAAGALYVLRTTTVVDAPLEETFAFFSKAANLGLITPPAMRFSILGSIPPMAQGALIDYRVHVGPFPVRWRTRITAWEPGHRFVDLQESGPYRVWWHEHSFHVEGTRTVMEDRVYYAPPLGVLGRIAHRLFIRRTLRTIFQYRGDVIRLRFGVSSRVHGTVPGAVNTPVSRFPRFAERNSVGS
ncbi:MAG: TIGR01777 family oxidoreductase [Acidobacteriota bacterium]